MLKKDITFIWSDGADLNAYEPIVREAKKRGYQTHLTRKIDAKCEIGFYCQHVNLPQNSRLSVVMLHDIIQQYQNWPDIWFNEPWNKYDIGLLPSRQWEKNWNECSKWRYTRPRMGMFLAGWPKADILKRYEDKKYKEKLLKSFGLHSGRKTVLYAPAWENDYKQDDLVQAMLPLNVNILIKQAAYNEEKFPDIVRNVREMEKLHKGIPAVTILPPKTNIFDAIAVSDILVSDESSTMVEAAMLGIPSVSVSDWLIPDTVPSRHANCGYDFVFKTKKALLSECVKELMADYEYEKKKFERFAEENFVNIGNTCSMIMDMIDDCVNDIPIRYQALNPRKEQKLPVLKELRRRRVQLGIQIRNYYGKRFPFLRTGWELASQIKHSVLKK